MSSTDQDRDSLLTVEEVARLLRVPKSWVYVHTRISSNPRLPHVKLGKYLRFRRTDIEEFMKKARGESLAHGTNTQ